MKTRFTSKARRLATRWQLGLALLLGGSVATGVQAQNGAVTTTQSFTYTGQIETWQVPTGVTSLTIEARGAEGAPNKEYGLKPGRGAVIQGMVLVTQGQQLSILVGRQPAQFGGGGGSFVVTSTNQPLIIAGGGGGPAYAQDQFNTFIDSPTKDGQAGRTGGAGSGINNSGGSGGANGLGGSGSTTTGGTYSINAAGGGGLLGDGQSTSNAAGGISFVNNGLAGQSDRSGGGGQGAVFIGVSGNSSGATVSSGGGGGGYSGGGGGGTRISSANGYYIGVGGGGGSYNADPNGISTGGTNSGNGLVTISYVLPCQPFTASLTNDGPLTCAKTSVTLTTTGGPAGSTYTYSPGAVASSTSSATATVTNSGPYSVTVTVPGGCSATAITTVTSNTTAPGVSINPASQTACQNQTASLTASGADAYTWNTGATTPSINVMATSSNIYSVIGTSASNGCTGTASATLTVNALPAPPSLVTQSGYPYPAGVSSLTISQNTGPISLTAVGCANGLISASGSNASSFTISTANTGTQTYTATCTQNGCTSSAGSFQLTVVPTTLKVLSRDPDNGLLNTNTLKPYLLLQNAGTTPIAYNTITLRYWLTTEDNVGLTFQKNYVAVGPNNLNLRYVPLATPRQGATGYIEYSFNAGAGSLASNGDSGPLEVQANKQDYGNFFQGDDYSYSTNGSYTLNPRITAYQNGTIFYGQEPTAVSSQTAVQVYSAPKEGISAYQIQPRLELRNTGNVALPLSGLRLRYYFTSDNNQPANVYVDYADIGAANVQARLIKLPAPVSGADSYLELRFPNSPLTLNAGSSLGAIDIRLVRSDNGLLDQSNDYSYAPNYSGLGLNNRITVLLNNRLIFGTPPSGAPARVGSDERIESLSVNVLGNPVVGQSVEVEISGVAGQTLQVKLVDLQGKMVHRHTIKEAGPVERVSLPLGNAPGMLLLDVSTASQRQQIKLVRP